MNDIGQGRVDNALAIRHIHDKNVETHQDGFLYFADVEMVIAVAVSDRGTTWVATFMSAISLDQRLQSSTGGF
jgi:hypothetical protein